MALALFILITSVIVTGGLILEYLDYWYIPVFFVIASFTFLVSVTYTAQDCEDLGKFKSLNNVYQCQMIKKEAKDENR